jgi:two-component system alkaline phosphatase synthesis response regulator PhoP
MKPIGVLPAVKPTPARVLVVDDEEDIRNLVAFNLRAAGMEALLAADGAAAIKRVRTEQPDLVILDLMMSEMDGISVCELIRNLPEASDTPIIMVTAWATERARAVGLRAGANEYITKPFSPRDLVKRVQSLLAEQTLRKRMGRTMELEHLTIDLDGTQVAANGKLIRMSGEEFEMLKSLVQTIFQRLNKGHKNGQQTPIQ